ncbi:MAG: lytic transglycosylase domain-containing protein [Acidobacteria bacterium]|nr:lytic transglycosylase domain-containing protein [Acidobacteriota bacterium]
MSFCFKFAWVGVASAALICAASVPESIPSRVTSIVRADPRSGRLVRSVVVSPRLIRSKVIRGVVPGPAASSSSNSATTDLGGMVETAAEKYNLDPLLVHSVIEVESNYNPWAVSNKGALGLMQLIPSTARRFGVRNVFDPRDNIEGGVRYLKYLSALFPSDLRLVLAAYNAGEGAVARHNDIPRYPETEQYVYRVGKAYGKRRAAARKTERVVLPSSPAAPANRPVEVYLDAEGRLNLRTR